MSNFAPLDPTDDDVTIDAIDADETVDGSAILEALRADAPATTELSPSPRLLLGLDAEPAAPFQRPTLPRQPPWRPATPDLRSSRHEFRTGRLQVIVVIAVVCFSAVAAAWSMGWFT